MKRILLALFTITLFAACSKNEESQPLNDVKSEPNWYDNFKIKDTVNLRVFKGFKVEDDTTLIGICGARNQKLWIGLFDTKSKDQVTEYNLDTIPAKRTKNLGYGETAEVEVEYILVSKFYKGVRSPKIVTTSGGVFTSVFVNYIYDLYFINGNSHKKHSDFTQEYFKLQPWYDDGAVVYSDIAGCSSYNSIGNREYDWHSSSDFNTIENPIIINSKEYIDISGTDEWHIYRNNAETGLKDWWKTIQNTNIQPNAKVAFIPMGLKIDTATYNIEIINYDGVKEKRELKININNGDIVK